MNSGLRASELALLRWSDVDPEHGRARLRTAKTLRGQYVVLGPKSVVALDELHRRHNNSEYVLGDEATAMLWCVAHQMRNLLGPRFHFHSLRRLFAARVAGVGAVGMEFGILLWVQRPRLRSNHGNTEECLRIAADVLQRIEEL